MIYLYYQKYRRHDGAYIFSILKYLKILFDLLNVLNVIHLAV